MWPVESSYPEVPHSTVDEKTYDNVVVGGGTAGCAVASRLSEDPNVSVLVLEKGFSRDNLLSRIPLLSSNFLFGDQLQVVSDRFSEPSPEVNGGRLKLWTAEGSWWNCVSMIGHGIQLNLFFRKSENTIARPHSQARGHDGPIKIRQFKTPFAWGPYIEKASQALDFPIVDDLNDPAAPAMGFYRLDQAVNERSERATSYQSYLNKSVAYERRSRLTICTGATALRLNMDKGNTSVRGVFVRPAKNGGKSTEDV